MTPDPLSRGQPGLIASRLGSSMRVTSAFLRTYRDHGRSAARLERVLAVGRAFLTVTALGAIYLDPTEPSRLAAITYGALLAYAAYSLAVLAWIHSGPPIVPLHGRLLHGIDILWASALTFVSEGPVSPFFLFFLFTVAASAYRWGFRETVATAVITVAVFLGETALAAIGPWNQTFLRGVAFELNATILRVAYLLLTGFLLGYLAEQEKQSRAELAAIADLQRQPRVDLGLRDSVTTIAESLLRTFGAQWAAVVLDDRTTNLVSLWRVAGSGAHGEPAAERLELDEAARAQWLFADPGRAWHATPAAWEAEVTLYVIDPDAWALKRVRWPLPGLIGMGADVRTVTAVNMGLTGEWQGRIYLFDIAGADSVERAVHFLDAAGERIAATLSNVFLLRRLRSQDTAAERARVARELHDGTIQTLFGVEMKLEALKRRAHLTDAVATEEIGQIEETIRGEVRALRQLMQALKPIELDANEKLPDVLVSVVERFRRDSGISARFVLNGKSPSLSPVAALEVVRIVQEALANARKHSRARNVLVRLSEQDGQHDLLVEDDGRGFEFDGRLTADELDARRLGPAIIKERARVLGAELAVQSTPGLGTRIELALRNHS